MIYLIQGENSYQNQIELNSLISDYTKKGFEIMSRHIDEEGDLKGLSSQILNIGFFANKKLTILRSIDKVTSSQSDELLKILACDIEIILFTNSKVDKRSRFYKFLKKEAKIIESKEIKDIGEFVQKEVKKQGIILSNNDLVYLKALLAKDLNIIISEISKLKSLQEEGVEINKEVIEKVITLSSDIKVWDLIDSLLKRNHTKSFQLLDILSFEMEYQMIVGAIVSQLRIIYLSLISTDRNFLAKMGVNYFAASKIVGVINKHNKKRLLSLYQKLVDIEIAVKTGKLEKEIALDLIVIAF